MRPCTKGFSLITSRERQQQIIIKLIIIVIKVIIIMIIIDKELGSWELPTIERCEKSL